MNFWYDPSRQIIINKVDYKNYSFSHWWLPIWIWWKP